MKKLDHRQIATQYQMLPNKTSLKEDAKRLGISSVFLGEIVREFNIEAVKGQCGRKPKFHDEVKELSHPKSSPYAEACRGVADAIKAKYNKSPLAGA